MMKVMRKRWHNAIYVMPAFHFQISFSVLKRHCQLLCVKKESMHGQTLTFNLSINYTLINVVVITEGINVVVITEGYRSTSGSSDS